LRHMMQLTSWLGLKQADQSFVRPRGFCRALLRAALAVLPSLTMTTCETTRPFERSADGSMVYLDQLSDEQKAAARDIGLRRVGLLAVISHHFAVLLKQGYGKAVNI